MSSEKVTATLVANDYLQKMAKNGTRLKDFIDMFIYSCVLNFFNCVAPSFIFTPQGEAFV